MTRTAPLYDTHTTLCTHIPHYAHTHIPCYTHITDTLNHLDTQDFNKQQS